MGTIIRANESCQVARGTTFNFEDMASQANQYLEKVRGEVRQLVERAKQESQQIKKQAQQQGYRAGQQEHEQVVRQQLGTVLPALQKVIADIQQAKQAWLREWEGAVVDVAARMAEKILARELTDTPEFAKQKVCEALELATGCSQLKIRLNPADHGQIGDHVDLLADALHPLATSEVVADEDISPGGCRVDTNFGVIDLQIETQLKRIVEELT